MIAAIYARKSTEQRGNLEAKSVTRQIAEARAFAKRMELGVIEEAAVYVDDEVSGADVKNLKARARLIADVEAGRISTVIMADMSRFSRREGYEVVAELKRISRKAAVYFYETGNLYIYKDLGSRVSNFVTAEANKDYRDKIRLKTMDAMRFKAGLGHVLGSPAFVYRNVDVMSGQTDSSGRSIRSHVWREVVESDAAIVREIFQRYASGEGFKRIADALNRKGTPTPRPKGVKDETTGKVVYRKASWATSNVRSILRNPLYRGIARWNYLKQKDEDGNSVLEVNPESEQKTFYNPDWRIVSDDLADAVEARFADENRKKFGSKPGARAKYLLSGGMLLCPSCVGRFEVQNGEYYVCGTRRKSGAAACSNPVSLRVEVVDDFFLGLLDGQVLAPAFIETCLNLVCGNRGDDARAQVEADRDELTKKIARLIEMGEAGIGEVFDLAAKIKKADAERAALNRRIAAMTEPPDRKALKAALQQRCKDWKKVLRSNHVEEARFVVRQLIGPITLLAGGKKKPAYLRHDGPPRGAEGIEFSECSFAAEITPFGLTNGLAGALNVVAGGGFEPPTFGL